MAYYAENPEERPEQLHCTTCGALCVDRYFEGIKDSIPVCGNVECGDCDAYILKAHMEDLKELEITK